MTYTILKDIYPVPEDFRKGAYIKSYNENEGMIRALVDAEVISDYIGTVGNSMVTIHRYKLTPNTLKLFES